jgi:hypothetical protein
MVFASSPRVCIAIEIRLEIQLCSALLPALQLPCHAEVDNDALAFLVSHDVACGDVPEWVSADGKVVAMI